MKKIAFWGVAKFEKKKEKTKKGDYRGFQLLEVRGNIKYKNKNHQILYIWFFVCSQKYRRMLQDVYTILFLVYRKIWLNLPRADCRLLLHLPMDGCHFGYQQKIPKTNHWCKHGSYTFFCVHGLFQGVLWNVIFVCLFSYVRLC